MKTPSRDELLATVRNYYDSGNEFLYKPEVSPATKRLQSLWDQRLENMGPWNAFLDELERELPTFNIGDTLSTSDGGPRCLIYPPKESRTPAGNWVVVGCTSLLAPVYIVYGGECDAINGRLRNEKVSFAPPPPGMALPAQIVARTIERAFGFSAISRELAETPVPLFVGNQAPPEAMLFHALFTSDPDSIP